MTVFEIYLKRLDKAFPDRETMTRPEVASYLGINRRTVLKEIQPTAGAEFNRTKRFSKVAIAQYLAGGQG